MHPRLIRTSLPFCTAIAALGVLLVVISACGGSNSPTSPETPVAAGGSGGTGSGDSSGGSGSGGSGDSGNTDGSGQSGTLTVRMRDDAIDQVCELWVHIVELRVKPSGEPVTFLGSIDETIDLLTLQNGKDAVLGDFGVPTGTYQFIEMLLDQDLSYVIEKDPDSELCLTDEEVPLQIPSEKFKIKGPPFAVTESTVAKIHFDAPKSLKEKGGGNGNGNGNSNGNGNKDDKESKGWMLKADVTLEDVVQEKK